MSHNPTVEGTILGTLQYMAPEQVEGKVEEIDGRTDIFAFGAVVYEMVTGRKAFEGKSTASLFAKILEHDPPPISSLQPMTPPALDRVVKRCLAKDPDERCQSAKDLTDELKWIAEGGSQAGLPARVIARPKGWEGLLAVVAAIAIVIAGAGWGTLAYFRRASAETFTTRFVMYPPEGWSLPAPRAGAATGAAAVAVSPDGRRVAFVAAGSDGRTQLWVRSLDALEAHALAGTEEAHAPFWSPDSGSLGFFAEGKLKKIQVAGGPPITLCDMDGYGGAWNREGVIFFNSSVGSSLQRVSSAGGAPADATVLAEGETDHSQPFFLPDGRHFLYTATAGGPGRPVYVGSIGSAERKLLFNTDSREVVYSQGHLLFLRETTLMAQPFDARRLELTGEAFPIAEEIQTNAITNPYGFFSASENGVLAYRTGIRAASTQLVWFDRQGRSLGTVGPPAAYNNLALSPDDQRVALGRNDPQAGTLDIWLFDLARGVPSRFTFDPAQDWDPVWSPDGSRIAFSSNRGDAPYNIYVKDSIGAGSEGRLFEAERDARVADWSPDGKTLLYVSAELLYVSADPTTGNDLWVAPLEGDRKPAQFLVTPFSETQGQFSPDGRWIAYRSNESGPNEIYVQPFPTGGGKFQISSGGGGQPRWRRDGKELFYIASDGTLMAVDVATAPRFEAGVPKALFESGILDANRPNFVFRYDVAADGQRFLINTLPEDAEPAPITVVVNWTAGLQR
jgi:Tol biopolymer transport system component